MAILRQANLLGQQRVDVPTLRQVEASIAGDFDMLAGRTLAANRPLVIRGFTINTQGVVGSAANTLQLTTADGIVANLEATESGSMLWIPTTRAAETLNSTTNSNVVGSFTPSATNNIGIDFVRGADSSTADVVQFLDPTSKLETAKIVPLARTLNYRIVITTQPFSAQPNLVPIATVVTTAQNNVSSIVDARNMFGRLAPGGDFPSATTGWSFSSPRTETATSSFTGPDKNFEGLKDWADAVMTRVWEVGGGEAWFSGTADRNVNFVFVGVPYASGEYFEWDGTNLHWKGLRFIFDNSTGRYNDIANQLTSSPGLTNLADGECVYVDLKREINATGGTALLAVKASLATLGTGSPPGSRTIFAWRDGSNVYYRGWRFPVGQGFAPATTASNGVVTLFQTPGSSIAPVVLNLNSNNSISWTASGGNATGLTVTGNGTGNGANFTGGGTNGTAVMATGGGTNGLAVIGTGVGTGAGVTGNAGGASAYGVDGIGVSAGPGIRARSTATNVTVLVADGYASFTGATNPATTTGFSNKLTPKNVCKAWATISTDGVGGLTVVDGFNIASAAVVGAGIQVTMASAMATANYTVNLTGESAATGFWATIINGVLPKTTTQFFFAASNAGGAFGLQSNATIVHVVVFAAQ